MNIRIAARAYAALEAAVFVRGARAPQELLRPMVEEWAAELAKDPQVRSALEARQVHQSATDDKGNPERPAGTVTPLRDRGRRGPKQP